jgi:membrane fusion protein (multidrug efflux system)
MINRMKKKKAIWAVIILLLIVAGYAYSIYSQRYVSTDDAYVNADVVQMAAQVTGPISHLYIVNNEFVKKDQPLLDIDPTPFQLAVEAADAAVTLKQAQLDDAKKTTERTMDLVKKKTVSSQAGDDAVAALKIAEAALHSTKVTLAQAKLDLTHAHVIAPISGFITNMAVYEGTTINANQPLFALISNAYYWIDANFKETELSLIRPGQRVVIQVDIYPEDHLEGVVDSISKGSGSVFSLLPPQNATGNWVKVTQRVPVKVRILNPPQDRPLRIGTSATVTVYVNSNLKFLQTIPKQTGIK